MKLLTFVVLAIILAASTAAAQGRGFGVGIIMGEPTGISAKGWLSPRSALDAGLAWSVRGDESFQAHVDYLWHFQDVFNTRQQILPYIGIGGRVVNEEHSSAAGVRIPVGLAWLPAGTPLDVFGEIAPVMDLAPETDLTLNGGIGIRFFFR